MEQVRDVLNGMFDWMSYVGGLAFFISFVSVLIMFFIGVNAKEEE